MCANIQAGEKLNDFSYCASDYESYFCGVVTPHFLTESNEY